MFNPNTGDKTDAPMPSLAVITGGGKPAFTLRQAVTMLLFYDDKPLYEVEAFQDLVTAQHNETAVTGLKGGDTWKATFWLIDEAKERGGMYIAITEAVPAKKVRDMMNDVLKKNGAGRNRQVTFEAAE